MTTFKEFYQELGFEKNPFQDRTAEKEETTDLFIAPPNYSMLEDAFVSGETAIISGNRGTGKTIVLLNIKKNSLEKPVVAYIGNYEAVGLSDNLLDFYSLLLQTITSEVLVYFVKHKKALRKLSRDDKEFLSFLIMKYADSITESGLSSKIEDVQLSIFQKIVNYISAPLTLLANFGSTVAVNFGSEFLNKQFGSYLPAVDEGKIKKIFPNIQFEVANDFRSVSISYSLLEKALKLFGEILGVAPIVILDKLDEDMRLENDANSTAIFVKDLLCDNNLLLNKHIQLFVSVWEIPFQNLSSEFRRTKHTVFNIAWNRTELEKVLDRRLAFYSGNKVHAFRDLFTDAIPTELIDKIFELSNMNPRDLWGIFYHILTAQYGIDNDSRHISKRAIEEGMVDFVKKFSFYEYYPKNKEARKNTNDIYSYIGHLLQLKDTDEFTHDELRQAASTGGSTTNYITGMVNCGLVKKTDRKRPGGAVIYKVIDPKISFAIFQNIEITH